MRLDALYHNGRITTLDDHRPNAHQIGVLGGRIVGVDEEVDGLPSDRRIDLAGQPVVPGFNDAHRHLLIAAQRHSQLDLTGSDGATMETVLSSVGSKVTLPATNPWILGFGLDHRRLGSRPYARELDAVAGDRPVWLEDITGHVGIANTAALKYAGLTEGGEGAYRTDAMVPVDDDGRATGVVKEHAVGLMRRVVGPTHPAELPALIGAVARQCAAEGVTSVAEAGVGATLGLGDGPTDATAFMTARESGRLPVRMTLMPYVTALHGAEGITVLNEWRGIDLGIRTGFGDEWLRIGPVKVLVDGSLRGRTAAMTSDYASAPGQKGIYQFDPIKYRKKVEQLHESGWQVASHAIGDAAVDVVLDAYEKTRKTIGMPRSRHRIEHASVLTDTQVARLARSGVVVVPQGRFISEMGDSAIEALGPERSHLAFRLKSLVSAGVVIAGSSDAPVAHGAPLLGIHDMVNRRTSGGAVVNGAEALSVKEALRAYTVGSAYAAGEEAYKGVLRKGCLADFTVLSDDILAIPESGIRDVGVGATVVGGDMVHNAGAIDA